MDDSSAERDAIDLTTTETMGRAVVARLRWLERAARATVNPGILRTIEDLARELRELGSLDGEMAAVVDGALESVAAALDIDHLAHRLN